MLAPDVGTGVNGRKSRSTLYSPERDWETGNTSKAAGRQQSRASHARSFKISPEVAACRRRVQVLVLNLEVDFLRLKNSHPLFFESSGSITG
jgi:hypothetical protein